MAAKWGSCVVLGLWLALSGAGCRSSQPNLKPPETAERFVEPPSRLETPGYPKMAFDTPEDPARRQMDLRAAGGMPARNMMGPGAGGMAGGGGGGMPGRGY